MANENLTTFQQLAEANRRVDEAMNLSSTLWAISQLGNMLSEAQTDKGFESLKDAHWSAIGISINRMAESLYLAQDSEIERLESEAGEIAEKHEAWQRLDHLFMEEFDTGERQQVYDLFKKASTGELTVENAKDLFPDIKRETAEKITELLDDEDFRFLTGWDDKELAAAS